MRLPLAQTYLPNNQKVYCINREEVATLYEQVKDYFKHDIEINQGDIVFDIGANIGLFSLQVDDLGCDNVNIYAFEPIPDIYNALERNAQKFNSSNIKTFPYGLGKKSQCLEFHYYSNASILSSMYPYQSVDERNQFRTLLQENLHELPFLLNLLDFLPEPLRSFAIDRLIDFILYEQKVTCQIKTISEVINEQNISHIDLLKIDVEKAELDVLMGIQKHDWSKIKQIVIEVHNIQNRFEKIYNLLEANGFSKIDYIQEDIFTQLDIYSVYASK